MKRTLALLSIATVSVAMFPATALAQSDLMSLDGDTLRGELQKRHDAGLAFTIDPGIVNGNDPRYIWASEAKVQCAIALGFMKSNTKDATSISKCALAYDMMNRQPRVAAPPPPPAPSEVCSREAPGIIFFEFDSATPGPEAAQVVQFVAQNAGPCNWRALQVTGHTDRAGSNSYNTTLSRARADAVAEMIAAAGVPRTMLTTDAQGEEHPRVPTEDGVRNPQNRRVEITVSQ